MALNITFDGFCSLNDSTMSNVNVQYQAYFYKVNAGSSTSTWNNVRTVEASGYWNINIGDGDWLTQDGNAASGDKVIIVFWKGADRMGTDCPVLEEWGAFEITLDGSSTYTNPTQVKENILPTLDWSFPVATGTVGTSYTTTNDSDDLHTWDWSGTTMGHYYIWNSEPIYFVNYVRFTSYDWDDGFQDNNLPLASTESHTWTVADDYTIEIVIEDHCGGTVTGTHNVRMLYPPPVPNINCIQDVANHVETPDTVVTFEYDGSNPYVRIYSIDWTIQDDTNTTTSGIVSDIIHHTEGTGTSWYGHTATPEAFTDPGTHNVAIVVYWNDGFDNQTTNYNENFIQDYFTGPTVDFDQIPDPVAVTSGVIFNNLTTVSGRVGTGFTPVDGAEYYWTWNDEGNIHTASDVDHDYIYSNTPVSDDVTIELCANWNDGWADQETCELKNLAIETTVAVVSKDCYYEITVFGTSDDGTTSGYGWDIYRSTTSGVGGPWQLLWGSPTGMDQKEKTVCFTETNFFKVEGFVYGTGATTSDYEIVSIDTPCPSGTVVSDCTLILWNGTGALDSGGDWTHTSHGTEAAYADAGNGTNGLDATGFTNNKNIHFQDALENNVDEYDLLSMNINLKAWDNEVLLTFEDGNSVPLSDYFNKTQFNAWQHVLIPLEAFGLTAPIDLKRLTYTSLGDNGFYLDDIEFVVGAAFRSVVDIGTPDIAVELGEIPATKSVDIDATPRTQAQPQVTAVDGPETRAGLVNEPSMKAGGVDNVPKMKAFPEPQNL